MKNERSVVELQIIQSIIEMEDKVDKTTLTIYDSKELIKSAVRCLEKCEELRKSRDNWRRKYEEIKNNF